MMKLFAAFSALVLVMSCSDGKGKKSDPPPPAAVVPKKDDKPKGADGSKPITVTPEDCLAKDQVFDEATSTCRSPSEKECFELGRTWWSNACHSFEPNKSISKNILNLDQHCEKNAHGAYINCKDFVIADPVKSTYAVKDTDPEWMKNGEWDISAEVQFICDMHGKVIFQPTGADAMDKAPSDDFIFRKISASNPAQIKVEFSEGAVVRSDCGLSVTQKYTIPGNFQLLADDYANGKVDSAWIIEQLHKVSTATYAPFVSSGLLYEWYTSIRDKLKGQVVYDAQRDCPADQLDNSSKLWTICKVAVSKTVQVDDNLKNKPLLSLCNSNFSRSPLSITMNDATYLLPIESKTPATDFTITAKNAALTKLCFVKIFN